MQRMVSIICVVIPAVIFIIGGIDKSIDEKLETRIEPINSWMITHTIFEIDKQYWKIKNDAEDIKPMDIELALKVYEGMNDNYKTALIEDKAGYIRQYAINNLK